MGEGFCLFTLASGRSGTHFLYELIRRNATDCVARHETYGLNPSLFGRPIYDHAVGEQRLIRQLLARKRRIVERCGASCYVETSHAFLKSWYDLAPEFFPRLKVVHLLRDPLKVAKSEAAREAILKRLHVPFCHYYGADAHRYFLWSLTGREAIFQQVPHLHLSRFQWYVLQWIEVENRAQRFLQKLDKQADCFTLHSPHELNDPRRVRELFDWLGLTLRSPEITIAGRTNKNWRATTITADDQREFAEVVSAMPAAYLDVFRHEPYETLPWGSALQLNSPDQT